MDPTVVHLVRHGEVDNPTGVLYGRLDGFGLSAHGHTMAARLGEYFADRPLAALLASPLQRTRETMAPIAATHPGLEVVLDERVIETKNVFEGTVVRRALRRPANWRHLVRPWQPSWGEPFKRIVARMHDAIRDAAAANHGKQIVIVSHQLPIWMARSAVEGRSLIHDPRRRQCTLASVTSFTLHGDRFVGVDYAEPAKDLLRSGIPHA